MQTPSPIQPTPTSATTATPLPPLLPPLPDNIPDALTSRPQWVVWQAVWQPTKGKYSKVPYNPRTGTKASSTDAATWGTFAEVLAACRQYPKRYAGVGFVLSEEDPFTAIDFDHCVTPDDAGNPRVEEAVQRWIVGLASYTELSPSGNGVRVFVTGTLPPGGRKRGDVEMYDAERFMTVTGQRLPGASEIGHRQEALEALHAEVFPPPHPHLQDTQGNPSVRTEAFHASPHPQVGPTLGQGTRLPDEELLERAFRARNSGKLRALWGGDISGYPSRSEAEAGLCCLLAFWAGGDALRMDRWFRQSGLYREKWDGKAYSDGSTYGSRTVQYAIRHLTQQYTQPGSDAAKEWAKRQREQRQAEMASQDDLPTIETNERHLRDITDDAVAALVRANGETPFLFARGGQMVRIEIDNQQPKIAALSENSLRHELARCANFVSTSLDRGTVPVAPPSVVVQDALSLNSFDFLPGLDSVVSAPVLSAASQSGSFHPGAGYPELITEPGYHPAARSYYHEPDARLPHALPDTTPTRANIEASKTLLLDTLFGDFPFAEEASRAHALALLLLPFVRPAIPGPTPLHIVTAPVQGTGKSLLVEIALAVFLGAIPASQSCPERHGDDEWRKLLTTALMEGGPYLWLDNLKYRLTAASLAQAITSSRWKDRVMGGNTSVELPIRCVWALTGNNVQTDDDFPRRTIAIRLDAHHERPEDRDIDAYRLPDIRQYVLAERPALVGAALTLVRAWLTAGRPAWTGKPLGTFEAWSRTIGGILEVAGVPGFLGNREETYKRADQETQRWQRFVVAWAERHGSQPVGVLTLAPLAIDCEMIPDDSRGSRITLGRWLSAREGRIYAGHTIRDGGAKDRASLFRLQLSSTRDSVAEYAEYAESNSTHTQESNTIPTPSPPSLPNREDSSVRADFNSLYSAHSAGEEEEKEERERGTIPHNPTKGDPQ